MEESFGILSYLLKHLTENLAKTGYANLQGYALSLVQVFIIIDLTILGVMWALGKQDIVATTLMKLITFGIFIYIIKDARNISREILETFGFAGLAAGGSNIDINELLNPSAIVDRGMLVCWPMLKKIQVSFSVMTLRWAGLGDALIYLISFFRVSSNLLVSLS